MHDLQSDLSFVPDIGGEIHDRHPSASELAIELVSVADGLLEALTHFR